MKKIFLRICLFMLSLILLWLYAILSPSGFASIFSEEGMVLKSMKVNGDEVLEAQIILREGLNVIDLRSDLRFFGKNELEVVYEWHDVLRYGRCEFISKGRSCDLGVFMGGGNVRCDICIPDR